MVGFFPDDLDGVLVGADGPVSAQPEKHGADSLVGFGNEGRVIIQAGVGNVIVNTDGKMVLWFVQFEIVQYAFHHGGSELF